MNISRGFRRLSLLAGFVGFGVIVFIWGDSNQMPSPTQLIFGLAIFGGLPAIFVLLLGWVVAGFRNSN